MLYSDFDTTSVEMRFESDFGLGSPKNIWHRRYEGIFLLGELEELLVHFFLEKPRANVLAECSFRGEQ